jgi:sugar phosphate isomerase/epimerase
MSENFQYYRSTVFVVGQGSIDWAKNFAIVTAHNPDGKPTVVEQEGVSGKQDKNRDIN